MLQHTCTHAYIVLCAEHVRGVVSLTTSAMLVQKAKFLLPSSPRKVEKKQSSDLYMGHPESPHWKGMDVQPKCPIPF